MAGVEWRENAVVGDVKESGVRMLDTAEGILVGLRGCGVEDVFAELIEVGRRHQLSPFAVASALVALAGHDNRSARLDPMAVAVVEQEWGELLHRAQRSPTDADRR